ncbi:PLC-like phosphodiesterase [Chaetomium strumarium]|uniref:PLC-like phosphodiesterase n=1 Tax=Chaetomium strumarium TaxID=1170767 RepID=A0AAJ0H1I8_9PEZI|nr:PLC-like phosphodiesterase [Chaetomium strumarium]
MPSKGVHAFTYIAVPGCSIELSVPGQTVKVEELNRFSKCHLEVEARAIDSFFDKRGRFTFKVFHQGNQITEQWIDVNALTGNASGGTMESIANQRSIVHGNGFIICYGLYEAGDGHDLLPAQHQCYITVAPNYADWMRSVAPPGSDRENKPFSRLVLPAAHDVGMNSMASSEAVLRRVGGAVVSTLIEHGDPKVREILSRLADKLSADAIALIAPNIIFSLAITQKDDLATMLQIGARYFEFRPARLHSAVRPTGALPDALYFQHSAIPGMAYDAFLRDVVAFLRDHGDEIVVVQLRWDGVPLDVCAGPADDEKRRCLDEALQQHANGEIVVGNLDDMKRHSIGQLRRERKRLIMLDSVDSLSTYTDEGNATLDGDSIVEALPRVLTRENQRGKAFVNIQCQATASNIPRAVVYSVLEASATTSCLLATKGICDSKTLPWCRDNVLDKCELDQLVVLMNDWIDGGTADVAVQLSRQRLER